MVRHIMRHEILYNDVGKLIVSTANGKPQTWNVVMRQWFYQNRS